MKVKFKKLMGVVHLWFGLASGLVVFIICITAAIWSFSPEIENLTQPYRHVPPQHKPFLPVTALQMIANKQLPGKKLQRLTFEGDDKAAIADFYGTGYYYAAYINPYNGQVLKVSNENRSFFRIVIQGHYTLWLGDFGGQVVKWSTLIFLIMLISGIVLWWPRNRAARKQRFKVKFGTSPKRLNYDLHNVLGFYASWIIIFAALTGIVWTFDSVSNAEYWLASGGKKAIAYSEPLSIKTGPVAPASRIDSLYNNIRRQYRDRVQMSSIQFAASDSAAIGISMYPRKGTYYNADNLYFDQYSLRQLPAKTYGKYADANGGEKLSRLNYDIHIGNILGFPGRVAMFLAVVVGASLPVTGFYIWWGKKKKVKKGCKEKSRQKKSLPVINNKPMSQA